MEQILSVFAGCDILTTAAEASVLRQRVEALLEGTPVVVLDFAGVNRVACSFVDHLIEPLFEQLGDRLPDRVLLDNCSPAVLGDLRAAAEMRVPGAGEDAGRKGSGRAAA